MHCFPRAAFLAFFMGAVTALSACAPEAGRNGVVNIYSARHYDADEALYAAFEKSSGIKVRRIEAGADQLIERMAAEGDGSPADVVLLVDAGNYWRADQRSLLAPFTSPTLDSIVPAHLRQADHHWFAIARRARVIAYDPTKLQPAQVDSYDDLASPDLRGHICMRSSSNIYNLSLMASRIAHLGQAKAQDWAKAIVGNFARDPEGADTSQLEAIAKGECWVSLVNHYYYVRYQTSQNPDERAIAAKVRLSFPDQTGTGTHQNISGAALAAHAPNLANAQAFLNFLLTEEAQKILANGNHEMPVLSTVTPDDALVRELSGAHFDELPLDELGKNQSAAQTVFENAGWQ